MLLPNELANMLLLSVVIKLNSISYRRDNRKGCHYGLWEFLMPFQPKIIIFQRQSNGGSKPPPYHVVVSTVSFATAFGCLSLTMQLLLFRKNHARLACSVVNALTTAHCHYQLLRFADRGKPCQNSYQIQFLLPPHL